MAIPGQSPALPPHIDAGARDALSRAHLRTVDALAGYERMLDKAEPSFRGTVAAFVALHARHADALARLLDGIGVVADRDGSLMGSVNEAVVSMRALFDRIDADMMDNIRSGERHVIAAYDEAAAGALPAHVQTQVRAMRDELAALVSRGHLEE